MVKIMVLFFICLFLVGCDSIRTEEPDYAIPDTTVKELDNVQNITEVKNQSTVEDNSDMLPVSRALAAKMIALALNDKNTIDALDIEIEFNDIDKDEWYVKYINAIVLQDIMKGMGDHFLPLEPLTINQAQILLDKIDPQNTLKIKITDENKDKPISYALWKDIFIKVLKDESQYGINKKNIIVLATPANDSTLKAWNMISDKGSFEFSGLNMDAYIDKQISVLEKDGEIISFLEIESDAPVVTNCYVTNVTENTVSVFVGGAKRTYYYEKSDKIPDKIINTVKGKIADVHIENGRFKKIVLSTDVIGGVIKRADTACIELDTHGDLPVWEDIKIYSVLDDVPKWKSIRDLTVGNDIAEFVLKDKKVCAAIIKKKADPNKIRVAINNTEFSNLLHQKVTLTCTTDFIVSYGKDIKSFSKGEIFELSVNGKDEFSDNRIYIKPQDNGKVQLQTTLRNNVQPQYRGVFELKRLDGGIGITNELGIEEYLYAVVPSEMPTGHGLEALKVQAVTARSYAYNQIFANRYHKYGANVDDSVQCQVYNNTPENQVSIEAVNNTRGECLTYSNEVVSANFFSTSAGITANSGEVWASGDSRKFPSEPPEYLTSQIQYKNVNFGDLSIEENAAEFFKATALDSYDANFPWFRWNLSMLTIEIAESINRNIKERYSQAPKLVKVLQDNNVYRSRPIETIGNLIDIFVTKRGVGGNIMEMKIVGSEATILVSTEYNIRMLIKPVRYIEGSRDIRLTRGDGSQLLNYSLMPSAFYVLDKKYDSNNNLISVTFYGGGNGHGVGMSQNGVFGMTSLGFNYKDILKHYYKGTDVKVLI